MLYRKQKLGKVSSGLEIEDYVLTATEKEAARMEKPMEKRWFDYLWYAMITFVFLLGVRVIFLTVIKGSHYENISKGNSVRNIVIKASRGRIYDRFGIPLVSNVPSIDAVMIPADIPREENEIIRVSQELGKILGMDASQLKEIFVAKASKSLNPILLKENISQDESLIILEKKDRLSGIGIEKTAIREYADGPIFSHILGYEGKIEPKELEANPDYLLTDYIGKQGLEKSYEKVLRGVDGANQMEVDSLGNIKREIGIVNPKPGSDLVLSIDSELQKKIYDSTNAILEKTKTFTASAVAINPKNGEILAMVNVPSYDNNLFARKISSREYADLIGNPNKPLFNRAVAGEYPPGSTIKPVISAAALSENIINESTTIDGMGGVLSLGAWSFRDWKVHGPSDVRTAIAESNDIFFYTIGGGYGNTQGLGMDRMKKWYNLFGLGQTTGIDIGGEVDGLIPDEQWKKDVIGERWSIGNSYHASIGQGYVTATPLQIANMTAALANGGTLYKPSLVSEIKKGNGEITKKEPEIIRSNFVSPEIMKVVREGMRKTILEGTAQPLKEMSIEVAGKTGTAQFGVDAKQEHGWFVSFAPYDDPQIAMAVIVEGAGEGFGSALPITKEVYEWYFGGRN